MSYAVSFCRSNLFKIAPDREDAFQRWAQGLGLGVKLFLEDGEKSFGIWPQGGDEGSWPFPSDQEDDEAVSYDDDPRMNVAYGLAEFLREGSVAVIAEVGAEFSGGDTTTIGGGAVAVNNKREIIEWQLSDILKSAARLGSECLDFEWRG